MHVNDGNVQPLEAKLVGRAGPGKLTDPWSGVEDKDQYRAIKTVID